MWKAAALLAIVAATAACGGDDGGGIAASTTTTAPASTSTTTSGPTSTSTATTASTTSTTRSAVPNAVAVVSAGPSAGSGEIGLRWNAVANASGYRVMRADAASGPFTVSADFDVTTGKTNAGADVTNVWSEQFSYKPVRSALARPDTSPRFEYVEIVSGGVSRRYFRVVAYNAGGDAPASVVVCGAPINQPAC